MNYWVTFWALGLAVSSFVLFAAEVLFALYRKPVAEASAIANKAAAAITPSPDAKGLVGASLPSVEDFAKLLSSMASLADSLAKAGPSLTSVTAAVLFLLIAAISTGAFQGSNAPAHADDCKATATHKCPGR